MSQKPNGGDVAAKIKEKESILDYLGPHLSEKPKPKEKYWSAHCFNSGAHNRGDKTASLSIREAEGTFHCFACGIHGDVIDAHAWFTNQSKEEAFVDLALKHRLLQPRAASAPEEFIKDRATKYAWNLTQHAEARAYLINERKLTEATIERFGLGYCWGSDLKNLPREHYNLAFESGVAWPRRKDDLPDSPPRPQMSGRITFPVRDKSGQVVAFGGRVVPGSSFPSADAPKYINTQETALFKKSEFLYGAYEARAAIRREGRAFVVEGYMDVVGLSQAKVENTVAVMGAGLNAVGWEKLWALTDHAVFCLDPDAAGQRGTARSIRNAGPSITDGRRISIMVLDSDLDPDEFVLAHGKEAFDRRAEESLTIAQFLIGIEAKEADLFSPEDRAKFVAKAKELAETFPNAPELRAQIVSEARAICAAAVADAALHFTNLDTKASERELAGAITVLQRALEQLQKQARVTAAEQAETAASDVGAPLTSQLPHPTHDATPSPDAGEVDAAARAISAFRPR